MLYDVTLRSECYKSMLRYYHCQMSIWGVVQSLYSLILMNNSFSIISHNNGYGFTMNLSSGQVDVPDVEGCYVVSTGCGSGKTENIKTLIAQKFNDGILYCVDTKAEVMRIYRWIVQNLCLGPGGSLGLSEVMALCGIENGDSQDTIMEKERMLNEYRNNPHCLLQKKVLLMTHVRFFSGLINYYTIYQPRGCSSALGAFDGNFERLMARDDLRKYILFDETPMFFKPFCTFPRSLLGIFSTTNANNCISCRTVQEIDHYYHHFLYNTPLDFVSNSHALSNLKRQTVLLMIPTMYIQWMNSANNPTILFTPNNLAQPIVRSHIVIFEGAGNVLFRGVGSYILLDAPYKYHATVHFNSFQWGLVRRQGANNTTDIQAAINLIKQIIINESSPTLVVVWKNLNNDANTEDFAQWVENEIRGDPHLAQRQFSVTYYGASDTKSTNQYHNYGNIVLCGNWSMAERDTASLRAAYMSTITNHEHRLWYYIQLISRIGIRQHNGGAYNVYISDDYSEDFVKCLSLYFNQNIYDFSLLKISLPKPNWIARLEQVKMRSNHRDEIITLATQYPSMQALILSQGIPSQFTIPLRELFAIVPRSICERGRYSSLKDALQKVGIELLIT